MKSLKNETLRSLIVCILLLLLPGNIHAWEPNTNDLDTAINSGDFGGYSTKISAWLNTKVPADPGSISEATLKALLEDPVFANTLDQRQFIARHGVAELGAFAKADQNNRKFLAWVLRNTRAMDLYLEAATPSGAKNREANTYKLNVRSLDIWRKIFNTDPDSKEGIYLRLAIATGLSPPPGKSYGSEVAIDPVERYKHYKTAHKNKELFPCFDNLSVWDLGKVVNSWASDRDLGWVREMVNTWRPDLRTNEQVVNIVSQVWRRFSPFPFDNGFVTVIEGGGKCGPRSWFGEMTCKAFGLPAQAMGQPKHSAVAYKATYPQVEPQPGSAWKICYGRGWHATFDGYQLLSEAAARDRVAEFSLTEHLTWIASTLTSKEQADAILAVVHKHQESLPKPGTGPNPAVGPDSKPTAIAKPPKTPPAPISLPEEPYEAVPGVIHVLAASFTKMGGQVSYQGLQKPGVFVYDCFTGGKQVNFQSNMQSAWTDYLIDVPAAGAYVMTMKTAAVNREQEFDISSGDKRLATIDVPMSAGLWATTPEVELKLDKGTQTLRISTGFQRGVAVKWFELKSRGETQVR